MGWTKKRFFEFRTGHSTYLAFAVSLATFVLIVHRLLIERVPELARIFGDLTIFTIVFAAVYIPLAIVIGKWHFTHQYKIESTIQFMQNPGMIRAFRLLLDLQTGTADQKDVESFKQLLRKLEAETSFTDLEGPKQDDKKK
jgi:hypothetical protein